MLCSQSVKHRHNSDEDLDASSCGGRDLKQVLGGWFGVPSIYAGVAGLDIWHGFKSMMSILQGGSKFWTLGSTTSFCYLGLLPLGAAAAAAEEEPPECDRGKAKRSQAGRLASNLDSE